MIEAIVFELNRLLDSVPSEVRENTIIILIGDNPTPNNFLNDYPSNHGKGSLYQGRIRVPMIIAGAGVRRKGERESALIHVADLHVPLLETADAEKPRGVYNSQSFYHLLSGNPGATREYNFSEIKNDPWNPGSYETSDTN